MKIVFVFDSALIFNPYEDVIRKLYNDGHVIIIVYGDGRKPFPVDRPLLAAKEKLPNLILTPLLLREKWGWLLDVTRRLLNRAPYLEPNHPSPWLLNRRTGFSRPIQIILETRIANYLLKSDRFQKILQKIESVILPDKAITRWLQDSEADVIIASPYILYNDHHEAEYIKAAKSLGIATAVVLYSWDHFLTKCTFQIFPDWVLVWNTVLGKDAVRFHGLPENKILITGAPHFDKWFDTQPVLSRDAFCRQVGLNPEKPFISYLCSALNGNEAAFVKEFIDSLAANPETRELSVLVRPYPSNIKIWEDFSAENVVVWPKDGSIPDMPEAQMDYLHTLCHSISVVGVSTTAFIEAAVIDRPCLTIMTPTFRYAQRMGHFQYLLDADFLEKAFSHEDASNKLAMILKGEDVKADNRRRFVSDFIRPWGVETQVSPIMATIVESIGRHDPASLKRFNPYLSEYQGIKPTP